MTPPPAPGASGSKPKLGLLLGLIGGAVLVLIAIILVIVLVVVPALSGGGGATSNANTIKDLTSEPEAKTDIDLTAGNDGDWVDSSFIDATAIGANQVLIIPPFDSTNYTGGDSNWYEGYDEHYELGYAAGEQYIADFDEYFNSGDFDADYPTEDNYWPSDFDGSYSDYDYETYGGFFDGFQDSAYYSEEFGYSAAEKPDDPDFAPSVALVDLNSGKEVWTVQVEDLVKDATFESQVSATEVTGTNFIALSVTTVNDDFEQASTIVTIDKSNGKEVSKLEVDGYAFAVDLDKALIINTIEIDEDGEPDNGKLASYNPGDLDGDPKWETDVDGYVDGAAIGKFIAVNAFEDGDEGKIYDAATGDEAKFGDDITSQVSYRYVGDKLLRLEYDDDFESVEIDRIGLDGKSVWKDTVEAERSWITDGAIFVADADGENSESLVRINPDNGQESWSDTYDETFGGVVGVVGNSVVLSGEDGKDFAVVNAGNGEEIYTGDADEFSSIYQGTNQIYVAGDDELVAYNVSKDDEVWSYKFDDDERIVRIGDRLAVLNSEKDELSILG